jgi:hypothetical protein
MSIMTTILSGMIIFPDFAGADRSRNMRIPYVLRHKISNMKDLKHTLVVMIACGALVMLSHTPVLSQYNPFPYKYFGLEASVGPKELSVKSNISAINGIKIAEDAMVFGMFLGNESIAGKARFGMVRSAGESSGVIEIQDKHAGVNLFPLKIAGAKSSWIRPYVIAGMDFTNFKFYGTYELPPPSSRNGSQHSCPLESEMTDDAAAAPAPSDAPPRKDQLLGKMNTTSFNTGVGLNIHISGETHFINFFAEASHGFLLSTKAMVLEYKDTRVSDSFSINAGVSFGLKWF